MKNEWLENKKNEEFNEKFLKESKNLIQGYPDGVLDIYYEYQFVQNEKPKWIKFKYDFIAGLKLNILPESITLHNSDSDKFYIDKKEVGSNIGYIKNKNGDSVGVVSYKSGILHCKLDEEELNNITISYEYKR